MASTEIVTSPAEKRQIARTLEFSALTAPHINWDSIAATARELGTHFEARYGLDGTCVVTMFWSYDEHEGDTELVMCDRCGNWHNPLFGVQDRMRRYCSRRCAGSSRNTEKAE